MKSVFTALLFAASVSLAVAQTSPQTTAKADTKKECCKKGKSCCKEGKEKTASTASKAKETKKN